MDSEILKTVGQLAGIGGIALGVFLLLFRDIVRKQIFPQLTRQQAFRLLRLIALFVWSVAVLGIGAWVWTEVRQDKVNIEPKSHRVDDLISVLNIRAREIQQYLQRRYSGNQGESGRMAENFTRLHEEHIELLRKGHIVAAHDLLAKIHELSFEVQEKDDELRGRLRRYYCGAPRYVRGFIVNAYIVNEFSENSDKYQLKENELATNAEGIGCGPIYKMAAPAAVKEIYELILTSK